MKKSGWGKREKAGKTQAREFIAGEKIEKQGGGIKRREGRETVRAPKYFENEIGWCTKVEWEGGKGGGANGSWGGECIGTREHCVWKKRHFDSKKVMCRSSTEAVRDSVSRTRSENWKEEKKYIRTSPGNWPKTGSGLYQGTKW